MTTTEKAIKLIEDNSKVWLAEKLGITRSTLYSRLETGKWKSLEVEKINAITFIKKHSIHAAQKKRRR